MPTPKSKRSNDGPATAVAKPSVNKAENSDRESIFNSFRNWGYLEGNLDPLGFLRPRPTPELQIENETGREARAIYSSTIGVEINHIYSPERRRWIYGENNANSAGRVAPRSTEGRETFPRIGEVSNLEQ